MGRLKAANSSGKDDLRRVIGIGPVNERRLNEHGTTTFAQIAAWTAADIKKAEEYLQFNGRIQRERWVAQAKLLVAGDERNLHAAFPRQDVPTTSDYLVTAWFPTPAVPVAGVLLQRIVIAAVPPCRSAAID